MPQFLKQYGEQLVALGYTVLPIRPGTKRPDLKNWPNHETTAADVVAWYSNGRAAHGAGINARNAPAIDVDVLDPDVAQQMSDAIDAIFPGERLMTRTGLAPKFLVPFRSDTPFRKMTSHVYTDGKNEHKVEILGDGQQWVAYHVHPDTERPYEWFDGFDDDGIRSSPRDTLPELTPDNARRVIDAFERIAAGMVASGRWRRRADTARDDGHSVVGETDDPFAEHATPTDLTPRQVEWLIHKRDPGAYKTWIDTGMAVHHQFEGSDEGFEIWDAWSANAQNYDETVMRAHWDSFGTGSHTPQTIRGLLKEFGQPPSDKPRPPNAGFVQAALFASSQKVEWHIKHVLPKRGLIVIYGEPGSSKSFFALDMVACVARGVEWRGHRVHQSNIAYIAAEGVAGFGNRLAAYAKHHEVDLADVPVYVRGGAFDLREEYLPIADDVKAIGDVGIVVIDTLAAATPVSNENTSEDMGSAIDAAQKIIEYTGASVILIHHSNNQGTIRGWSGLRGAVDNQIRIERKETLRTAHVEKQKEGAEGPPVGYRLKVIDLYTDEDGDPVTSCVVVPDEETAPNTRNAKKDRKPRSGDFETSDNYKFARVYLRIIDDLLGLGDANIDEDDVIRAIQSDSELNPMGYEDTPAMRSIKRSLHTLGEKGKIRKEGRWIRRCT